MENFSIKSIKHFITITKITPILIAFIHLINEIVGFLGFNDIPLNYISGISLIPIIYLYYTSYVFKLCSYYRMFLHYAVTINIINTIDFYIGFPFDDIQYIIFHIIVTLVFMFIIIKLKFFK